MAKNIPSNYPWIICLTFVTGLVRPTESNAVTTGDLALDSRYAHYTNINQSDTEGTVDMKHDTTPDSPTTTTADPNEEIIEAATTQSNYTSMNESLLSPIVSNTSDINNFTDEHFTGSPSTESSFLVSNATRKTVLTQYPGLSTKQIPLFRTETPLSVFEKWRILMHRFPYSETTPTVETTTSILSAAMQNLKYHILPLNSDNITCPFGFEPNMTLYKCIHLCENKHCQNGGVCYIEIDDSNDPVVKCRCRETFKKIYTGENCDNWEIGRGLERAITLGILIPLGVFLLVSYVVMCNKVKRNRKEEFAIRTGPKDDI